MLTKDTHDWLARAMALAPLIEAAGGRTEMERKIPADVLSAMHAARLFHILLPVSLGGGGVDLVTFNEVVETLAAADASPAWCLAQAAVTSHAAGFLEPKIAREVFGASDALVAWGPPAGIAKALAVDGGYRVTGKWRFASGSANATWMGGHSTVFEASDKPRRDAGGNPINRTMLFRRERAHIGDTWHVLGLRGTASHDYEVTDLFVPEEYTTWRDSAADRRESGPLYNIPMLTLYGVGFSGVALGIAGSSLAAFMQLAQTKRSGGGLGSVSPAAGVPVGGVPVAYNGSSLGLTGNVSATSDAQVSKVAAAKIPRPKISASTAFGISGCAMPVTSRRRRTGAGAAAAVVAPMIPHCRRPPARWRAKPSSSRIYAQV